MEDLRVDGRILERILMLKDIGQELDSPGSG